MSFGINTLAARAIVALTIERGISGKTIIHKLVGIHKLRHARQLLDTIISVIRDSCLLCLVCTLAALGGNHDDTGRGTGTIDGGRRCIFQYVDAVDIIRVEEVHVVANYTIDNIQWLCLLVDRSLSTNLNIEACTCAATRLGDVDTRNRTLQRLCKIGSTTSGYLFRVDRCNRAGYVAFTHSTITNDNDLVKSCIVIFKYDVPCFLTSYFYFLRLAADVAESQDRIRVCVLNGKLTVKVGDATCLTILVCNGYTNHWVAISILNGTLDCFLRKGEETNRTQGQCHAGTFQLLIHNDVCFVGYY